MNTVTIVPPIFDCEIFGELSKFKLDLKVDKDDDSSDSDQSVSSDIKTDVDCSPSR